MEDHKTDGRKNGKKLPGFYIALCCCVLAVGLAGFLSQRANAPEEDVPELVVKTEDNAPPAVAESAVSEASAEPEINNEQAAEPDAEEAAALSEYEIDNPDTEPAAFIVNAAEGGSMGDPVPPAAVLTGFSGDTLRYNEIYSDWRTHNGIDIAADVGCSVSAAADGTVTDTGAGSMGGYVTIDHGNGITAVYAQLGDISVSAGDYVKSGSVIGTIAEPRGESGAASHLHYEIMKDGKYVDPEEY